MDEAQVLLVRRRRAGEVAALEDLRLLRADLRRELLGEVLPHVHLVEPGMTKRIQRDLLALLLELGDDLLHARTLGNEDVHAVVLVHDRPKTLGLGLDVDLRLGHVHRVDVLALAREAELRQELDAAVEHLVVGDRRERRQPPAVAPHHLVDDERARVRAVLLDDVHEEPRALLRRRVGAEGLLDRVDVVVDRLGEAHDRERVVVLREIRRKVRRRRVRVVAANRVEDVHAVLHELVRRHLERILALLHEPALHAVLHVRELHAAVADRTAAVLREHERVLAHLGRDRDRLALEEAHVTVNVADHLDLRRPLRVLVNQEPDRGTETGRETARREKRHLLDSHVLLPFVETLNVEC